MLRIVADIMWVHVGDMQFSNVKAGGLYCEYIVFKGQLFEMLISI